MLLLAKAKLIISISISMMSVALIQGTVITPEQ